MTQGVQFRPSALLVTKFISLANIHSTKNPNVSLFDVSLKSFDSFETFDTNTTVVFSFVFAECMLKYFFKLQLLAH